MKVALTAHQEKFIATKMKTGGYLSPDEIVREALRVYELNEQDDGDPALEAALRKSLRSPLKKYRTGHFLSLPKR
jgi:putative addiction module CopG family antidote